MKKSKNSKTLWAGFFLNLLGVILGILLTFGVNSLWQQHEEKKKIREMLILVRNELEVNKDWFKVQERFMRKDANVYKKILEAKGNWASFPADTLDAYFSQTISWEYTQLTTSSWQIFQNSEIIQKMPDRELVIRLADCYFWIGKVQEIIMKEYWDHKSKVREFAIYDPYKHFDALMKNREIVFFYAIMCADGNSIWDIFPTIDAMIDYTLSLLDNDGDYRYNMADKDKEFESFIQARIDSVNHSKKTKKDR